MLSYEGDCVANRHELRRHMVRDVDVEFLFKRHDDLDDVEAVGSQVFDQFGVVREGCFFRSEVKDKNVPDLRSNVGHHTSPSALPPTGRARRP